MLDGIHCGPFRVSDSIGLHVRSGINPTPTSDIRLGQIYALPDGHLGYRHPEGTEYVLTPPGSGGGGISGIELQSESVSLGPVTVINFSGAGVTASINGGVGDVIIQAGGASNGSAVRWDVTQSGHGFGVGRPVQIDGVTDNWALANANVATDVCDAVVAEVYDPNRFAVQVAGRLVLTAGEWSELLSGVFVFGTHPSPGETYWLGSGIGVVTPNKPTVGIQQTLLIAESGLSAIVSIGPALLPSESQYLEAIENLADLDDAVDARANLGLGSAALANIGSMPSTVFSGSAVFNADVTFNGYVRYEDSVLLSFNSDLDNWSGGVGPVWNLEPQTATRTITGIVMTAGSRITLINLGSVNFRLENEGASSAQNRISMPPAFSFWVVEPNETVELLYNNLIGRWWVIGGTSDGT